MKEFKPDVAERREKLSKWRDKLYRNLFFCTVGVSLFLVLLLFWTLRGNLQLQRELNTKTLTAQQ